MKRLLAKQCLVAAVLVSPIFSHSWAMGPCMPIAKACMSTGEYSDKKTLVRECVLPVAMGKKSLPDTNFSSDQMDQCKMEIMQKMEQKAGGM